MDNRYLLLPLFVFLIVFILTSNKSHFNNNLSFVYLNYDKNCTTETSCSLSSINDDLSKLNKFKDNITVTNYKFNNSFSNNNVMLAYLYNYIDNLNTVLIKQNVWLQDFYGSKYFPFYRSKSQAKYKDTPNSSGYDSSNAGSITDIKPESGYEIDWNNPGYIRTVEVKGAGNNSCN